jgi:hypothetical protein
VDDQAGRSAAAGVAVTAGTQHHRNSLLTAPCDRSIGFHRVTWASDAQRYLCRVAKVLRTAQRDEIVIAWPHHATFHLRGECAPCLVRHCSRRRRRRRYGGSCDPRQEQQRPSTGQQSAPACSAVVWLPPDARHPYVTLPLLAQVIVHAAAPRCEFQPESQRSQWPERPQVCRLPAAPPEWAKRQETSHAL